MKNRKDQLLKAVHEHFAFLIHKREFKLCDTSSDDESFALEFISKVFDVKLEKYRREIYAYVRKHGCADDEINLFALVQYLHRDEAAQPSSNYFPAVKDLDDSLRMQTRWIAETFRCHWREIEQFFLSSELDKNLERINAYVMTQHPELFAKAKS
jgi:hypothetical protein